MAVGIGTALLGSALIGGVGSAISSSAAASAQEDAAKSAAKAQLKGLDAAVAEQRRQYDLTRSDAAPYRAVGTEAAYSLADMMGLNLPKVSSLADDQIAQIDDQILSLQLMMTGKGANGRRKLQDQISFLNDRKDELVAQSEATPSRTTYDFETSPGYQFRLNEGLKGIERFAAAKGMLNSGATLKAMNKFAQDYASGEYGNEFNRLATLAGFGNQPTGGAESANIANLYSQTGNTQAQQYLNMGNARAGLYSGMNDALQGTLSNVTMLPFLLQAYGGNA